jgi:hypothetical protein
VPQPVFIPVITVSATVQLLAANGTNYQWLLDGQPIAGATTAQYTAVQTGIYMLTMTNTAGCTGNSEPLFVQVGTTGSAHALLTEALRLFPNPANQVIHIELAHPQEMEYLFDVCSSDGKLVERNISSTQQGECTRASLDVASFVPGTYFLLVYDKERRFLRERRFEVVR